MILKAVHKPMCTNTARAEKRTTVNTVGNGISLRHAPSADNLPAADICSVASVQHHHIQWQTRHIATVRQCSTLLAQRALHYSAQLLFHQAHNACRTENMQTWENTRIGVQLAAETTLEIIVTVHFTASSIVIQF